MSIAINTLRYGLVEVDEDKVINFPRGLAGFETSHRFAFLHLENDGEPVHFILQSLDDPEATLIVADPALLGYSYEITLNDELNSLLGQSDSDGVSDDAVLVILYRESPKAPLRPAVQAPLILNLKTRKGVQHILKRIDNATENKA